MCTQFPALCSPRPLLVGDLPADHHSTLCVQAAREYPQLSMWPAQHDTLTPPLGRAHSPSTVPETDLAADQSSQHQSAGEEGTKSISYKHVLDLWVYTIACLMHVDSQCSWCIHPVVLQSFAQKLMREELSGQPARKKSSRLPYPVKWESVAWWIAGSGDCCGRSGRCRRDYWCVTWWPLDDSFIPVSAMLISFLWNLGGFPTQPVEGSYFRTFLASCTCKWESPNMTHYY